MATDVYFSILEQAQAVVAGLGLEGITGSNVKLRMLPVAREVLDTVPCVIVCPSEGAEEVEPLSFEDDAAFEVTYGVDVVQVEANNADFSTNLEDYLRAREQRRRAFHEQLLQNVDQVFRVRMRPWAPLDRSKLSQLYSYSGFTLLFSTVEPREDG